MSRILDFCSELPVRTFAAGEVVLPYGTKDGAIYILRKGAVEISKRGVAMGSTATPGTLFGEVAVLLDRPHTAEVTAIEASDFYLAEDGEGLLHRHQELFQEIARQLASRLVRASDRVIEMHDQMIAHGVDDEEPMLGELRGLAYHWWD